MATRNGSDFEPAGVPVVDPIALLAPLAFSVVTGTARTVAAHSGKVKGSTEGDISAFLGIPYAAPSVSEDRWRAPQPVEAWEGVREATEYGYDCSQVIFPPNGLPGIRAPRRWTSANAW